MKIYKLVYNANKPSDKQVLVPNYETNKVGVVVVKDGEKIELAEEDVVLVDGSTEIEADGTYSDMITLPITTGRFDENKTYKVKIENDDVSLVFNLVVNSVKSSVIEVDSEGSEYELPIASETVLGGIKVGDNLTIDEDGTLNAEGGSGEETDPVFTEWKGGTEIAAGSTSAAVGENSAAYGFHSQGIGASSLALGAHARAEGQGSVQIGQGTNANDGTFQVGSYQMLDSRGEVPRDRLPLATPTGKGVVKVGDGLTIDSDGKLNVESITVEEVDPQFNQWRSAQILSAGYSSSSEGTHAVALGMNAEAKGNDAVALGYNAYVDGSGSVQLGQGVNETNDTLQFQSYPLCDGDGYIPAARLGGIPTATLSGTYDDDSTFELEVYIKNT